MSNVLKVSLQATIYSLHDRGWSGRRIARELGINRETVGRYLRLAKGAKPAISTPGLEGDSESKPAILTPGVEGDAEAKPAISTAGKSVGRKSQCEPLAEVIMAKVEVGLSAQRIYQDLVEESGLTDSYQSVKRFVRKLRAARPAFYTPDPLRPAHFEFTAEAFYRFVGIAEPVFLYQILVNMLSAQSDLYLGRDRCNERLTLTLASAIFAGGRIGRFCSRGSFRAGGRNGWFCQPQIPTNRFSIDPKFFRYASLGPSSIG